MTLCAAVSVTGRCSWNPAVKNTSGFMRHFIRPCRCLELAFCTSIESRIRRCGSSSSCKCSLFSPNACQMPVRETRSGIGVFRRQQWNRKWLLTHMSQFDANGSVFVMMMTTTKMCYFLWKWLRKKQKQANFCWRDENYNKNFWWQNDDDNLGTFVSTFLKITEDNQHFVFCFTPTVSLVRVHAYSVY